MRVRRYWPTFLLLALLSSVDGYAEDTRTLKISVLVTGSEHRSVFYDLGERFEAEHPGVEIEWLAHRDEVYKQRLDDWLAGSSGPDVVYWQAGMRLRHQVRQDRLAPIDSLWRQHGLDRHYTASVKESVSVDGRVYAIPYSYYQWGVYYRESLFDRLDLEVPTTWDELVRTCDRLNAAGVTPFTIGTRHKWPAAAWFDYINLRLNGIEFHRAVVAGRVAFTHPRVRAVLERWRTLLEHDCFPPFAVHSEHDWESALPFLYHGLAGMTLMGNFLAAQLPESVRGDVRFFRFPTLDPEIGRYEEAPTDVFTLPKRSADDPAARAFLAYMASARAQGHLNNRIGKISTNREARTADDYFIRRGAELLRRAHGLTQFFDRDAPPALAAPVMDALQRFMEHRDVERALTQLESARRRFLEQRPGASSEAASETAANDARVSGP